ncbi:MAG: efflux RND transporter periplasmic adaptor subunit [Bacteroidaceae bacterium]|nr:efflux RND transporter periplasmic adaptor subunit [Bacteroidaceae bacterium]
MDKPIPKRERNIHTLKSIGKIAGVLAALCLVILIIIEISRASISEASLSFATIDRGTIETTISASGNVQSTSELIINSPISSRIVDVYCKNGDSITAGTRLLHLDLKDAESEYQKLLDEKEIKQQQLLQQRLNDETMLANMHTNIEISEMEFKRLQSELLNEQHLDSIGSGTTEKVRQCEMAVTTARLKLEQSRQQLQREKEIRLSNRRVSELQYNIFIEQLEASRKRLADAQMPAPQNGTITFINNSKGAQVAAGSHIATLADLSSFKISAKLGENLADNLATGKDVIVKIGKETLTGKISNVEAKSEGGNIAFDISLDEPSHPKLRYGMRVDVYILHRIREDVLRIKNGNYYKGAGEYAFFVKEGEKIVRRKVQLGNSNYDYVEVVAGLDEGCQVVLNDMENYNSRKEIKLK